ncbi:Protein of uncharacterised function (DUF1310) [Listeria grayi]|uniref:DUF1310 domain-containing protein n=3 Tax=Listeria grayi TaxID=1641 RepID=D7UX73_LISGR|nr:DUF1310 family protein [Listeria grayi]EFI84281.1 hypothetical protein HMPREF0556_10834 [Listeria grayi DSM 20601]EUJ26270.1 hypothetical protein LMUR_13759 [Listeria grayi FSL F6-1183]VEI32089.1 Protein of uncharacterised function (DUF1310) [Listeria grayi]
MKKFLLYAIGIVLLLILVIGGKIYMDHKKMNEDMLKVVKSDEAKEVFEDGLRNIDSKSLTSEGVIKSYKIDYSSIDHNPMGGIMVTLIINNDKNLTAEYDLGRKNDKLKGDGIVLTYELSKRLGRTEKEHNNE